MLKLMSSVLFLLILCSGLHSNNGEALQCEFKDNSYFESTFYSCFVNSLKNPNDNKIITGYSGVHMGNRNNKDVKQIYIHDTDTKYIPANLGSLFNLSALLIQRSQLKEIRSKDFYGMENLEYLSFYNNSLTSVPSNVFLTLTKLKYISLSSNRIKYIGSGAFDQLKSLNTVYLYSNICLHKYYNEAFAITQMKRDLIVNCVEPISTTTTTQNPLENELAKAKDQQQKNEIELNKLQDDLKKEQLENTKIRLEKDALMNDKDALKMELNNKTSEINELKTDRKHSNEAEGAVDVKLNVMNAMMEQLLKASQEHQMECNEIIKLRAELLTAKDELKMTNDQREKEQDDKIKVTNKNDQLDKELTEAQETIQQKLPKMEQLIEDFYMEVMDLKIERHNERQNSIALRTKLMEANEQLAECKNE